MYDLDDVELDDMVEVEELNPRKVMRDETIFEEATPFSELNFGSAKVMRAMAWVILRRENPELVFEDVGKTTMVAFAEPDEEAPETGPPGEDEEKSRNGSDLVDSGVPASAIPLPG